MALTIGIVGLPNAGKSTLFNALTKNNVLAANYPFATIEPNVGVVGVPDSRLAKLAEIFGSAKVLPATVEFVDIAGIVRGASEGEGLGNKFLSHIRESAAICQVTRVFRDEDVTHVDGEVNPANDISTIQTELILADLQTVEKALPRLEKEARLKKETAAVLEAVKEAKEALESGKLSLDDPLSKYFPDYPEPGAAAKLIVVWMVSCAVVSIVVSVFDCVLVGISPIRGPQNFRGSAALFLRAQPFALRGFGPLLPGVTHAPFPDPSPGACPHRRTRRSGRGRCRRCCRRRACPPTRWPARAPARSPPALLPRPMHAATPSPPP